MAGPSESKSPVIAVLQADACCDVCGFNLHGQRIWRDDRIRVFVCRCPECGTLQPAGRQTSAWAATAMRRLAILFALAWVGVAVAFAGSVGFGLYAIDELALDAFTAKRFADVDGRPLEMTYRASGTSQTHSNQFVHDLAADGATAVPAERVRRRWFLQPWLGGPDIAMVRRDPVPVAVAAALLAIATGLAAAALSAVTWFWPARRQWFWLLLPVVAAAACLIRRELSDPWFRADAYLIDSNTSATIEAVTTGAWAAVAIALAGQCACFAVGLCIGPAIARGLLTLALPPGLRRHFTFLSADPDAATRES